MPRTELPSLHSTFAPNGGVEEQHKKYVGSPFELVGPLPLDLYDHQDDMEMWIVRFPDGVELHVFTDEISPD